MEERAGSSSGATKLQPSEDDVVAAACSVLEATPQLGLGKLLVQLQNDKHWTLSEKRLKTILQAAGLRGENVGANANVNGNSSGSTLKKKRKAKAATSSAPAYVPRSHIDTGLPIPDGVKATYFDEVKGKGLVADRDYREGETIFTEDAFIAAPPSHALKQVDDGELCTACFAPLNGSLIVRCGLKDCFARFCNRLCQGRANSTHHQLLCPGQNPSIRPFRKYLAIQRWLSLSLVSRMVARTLLTHASNGQGPPSIAMTQADGSSNRSDDVPRASTDETLAHLDAFATVSELERRARNPGWDVERASYMKGMEEGHRLLCQGMDPRVERKGRYPVRASSFPADVAEDLFSWDAFIRMLGRANLNSEAQGGMYLVHSHLNHSCAPNIAIRHPPHPRTSVRQATRVAAVAIELITAGTELCITYQPPDVPIARRRMLLWREYMFGPCQCPRCVDEESRLDEDEKAALQNGDWTRDSKAEEEIAKRKAHAEMLEQLDKDRRAKLASEGKRVPEEHELVGLEDELRTSLGF